MFGRVWRTRNRDHIYLDNILCIYIYIYIYNMYVILFFLPDSVAAPIETTTTLTSKAHLSGARPWASLLRVYLGKVESTV